MPRPPETPDVRASKTLSYILRHGAEKESLYMRSDGYIRLSDVLARPKMRDIDLEMVLRIVAENAKRRFELAYGYDPSPPRPVKLRKGQQPKKVRAPPQNEANGTTLEGVSHSVKGKEVDAAKVEDLSVNLRATTLEPVELPLVIFPKPDDALQCDTTTIESDSAPRESIPDSTSKRTEGEYFIRATQGHSIKLESTAHLDPVADDEEGIKRAGVCVHGTKWELWDTLLSQGLSRMTRTHIHLAPALSDHAILPRPNSTLRIYLDVHKLSQGGIPLYTSLNGVVLTPGDENGVVKSEYWSMAERKVNGQWETIWRDGKAVESDKI